MGKLRGAAASAASVYGLRRPSSLGEAPATGEVPLVIDSAEDAAMDSRGKPYTALATLSSTQSPSV